MGLLEFCIREDLNKKTGRLLTVIHPLKVVIENYPEGQTEELEAVNNPEDESMGTRKVPFSRIIYIERDDFMEDPPKKYFRLSPGGEVRLRYAYFIKCNDVIKDKNGHILELRCTYDPESKGGKSPDGRKVKGTIHWVSVQHAIEAEIRLYDRLFSKEDPTEVQEGQTFIDNLNPDSLQLVKGFTEPHARGAKPFDKFQFERLGYFCVDPDSDFDRLIFNRTVALRDSWAKISSKSN